MHNEPGVGYVISELQQKKVEKKKNREQAKCCTSIYIDQECQQCPPLLFYDRLPVEAIISPLIIHPISWSMELNARGPAH